MYMITHILDNTVSIKQKPLYYILLGSYQPWRSGEPNNRSGSEFCVMAVPFKSHAWADETCSTFNEFICEVGMLHYDSYINKLESM